MVGGLSIETYCINGKMSVAMYVTMAQSKVKISFLNHQPAFRGETRKSWPKLQR